MYISSIELKNFRMFRILKLTLNQGLNVFVGENNSGKTAVLDSIRYVLDTNSAENIVISEDDFYKNEQFFSVHIIFSDLTNKEAAPFAEYITCTDNGSIELHIRLNCDRKPSGRNKYGFIKKCIRTGRDGLGPELGADAKEILAVTFLKPLRDADMELSAGQHSRLAQILQGYFGVKEEEFDTKGQTLIQLVKEYNDKLQKEINKLKEGGGGETIAQKIETHYLDRLLLDLKHISLQFVSGKDFLTYKNLLKKLNLSFYEEYSGKQGLGYLNLLFMAAELLLLQEDSEAPIKTLIIEEPEAHLHPQHQIKFLQFIKELLGDGKNFQIFISTHSPNISSQVCVSDLYICKDGDVFPLRKTEAKLEDEDYKFLHKFLDVTKADLFFARGLIFVEGISEQLVLPTIAEQKLKFLLANKGISIISVNGKAFKRFVGIFKDREGKERINIPISCIRDKDQDENKSETERNQNELKLKNEIESIPCRYHKVFISERKNFEYSFLNTNKDLILQALMNTYSEQHREEKMQELKSKSENDLCDVIKNHSKSEVSFQLANLITETCEIPQYLIDAIKHVKECLENGSSNENADNNG